MRTCLLVLCLLAAVPSASAQTTVTLAWDPTPEPDVAGYVLSWGTRPGQFVTGIDVGKTTEWTLTGLNPHQKYYFTVQAYSSGRVLSAKAAPVSNDGVLIQSGGTSTHTAGTVDDRPSLFWHHRTTGELLTWHLVGDTVADTRAISIPSVDASWSVAGTGDFNGDGFSDLLWRHADGWLAVWYLQNNQVIHTGYLSINRMHDAKWRIAGVGDTDGDRNADILWQHTDGWLAVWFVRGTTVMSTQFLSIPRMGDPQWRIAAVGDLDRDGRADLVWQSNQGWLATWLLDRTTVKLTSYFSIDRVADPQWQIVAASATSAGGPPALVWRHTGSGAVALWHVNGASVVNTVQTNPGRVADADWRIVGGR